MGKRNDFAEKFDLHIKTFVQNELRDIDSCFEVIKNRMFFEDKGNGGYKSLNLTLEAVALKENGNISALIHMLK